MVCVAALTLLAGSEWALAVGVALSIALLLQRSARPHVARIGRVGQTEHYRNVDRHAVQCTPGVLGLRIDESLLFTNARRLAGVVDAHLQTQPDTRRVVLLMSPVNAIDFSGLEALHALHDVLAARGIRLDLTEVKGPVLDRLRAGGWAQWFSGRIFLSHHQGMRDEAGRDA
jgi:SulP family sulfate permease